MRRWAGLSLLCMLYCLRSVAIEAVASYSLFYLPDGNNYKPYIELYWQIAPNSLHYKEADQFASKVKTDVMVSSEGATIMEDHYLLQTMNAASIKQAQHQTILEQKKIILPLSSNSIKITLHLAEVSNPENVFVYTDSMVLPATEVLKPFYSSLQILDTGYASAERSIFNKNGRVQIPLCANFLDNERKLLHYYTELYVPESVQGSQLVQTVSISKKPLDGAIYNLRKTDTVKNAKLVPAWGDMNIGKLPSGNYHLNIVTSIGGVDVATKSFFFQRINTTKDTSKNTTDSNAVFEKVNVFDLSTTFVAKYTLPQLKAILKMIKPISKTLEIQAIENFAKMPDENYMRYFIYNFWKERNPTNPKEAWDKYAELVREVNRRFGGGGMAGYETERGVIYLKYGQPDELISVENEQGSEPYEIWTYNKMSTQSNGGMLLFYRPGFMVGDYKVLHSNVRGETRNLNWRSLLYKGGQSGNNLNARAEQYFPGNK